jgi:dTMP kinase
MSDAIRIERDGPVAVLIVDRPAVRNALDPATMTALGEAIGTLADRSDVRAVVLCGGGDRFIAGGDLRALASVRTPEGAQQMATLMQRVLNDLAALPMPVIAAIDRFALGGGAEIALACDLRVACADAFLVFKQTDLALTTAWGASRRLTTLLGESRALHLLWTGTRITAGEALAMGLINEVAPLGTTARAAATELAHRLAERPGTAVAGIKQLVQAVPRLEHAAQEALEARVFSHTWAAPAHWQAVDDFWAQRADRVPAPQAPKRGLFIVLEGLDGAGTTTQARILSDWLRTQGHPVHQTHEPSAGPLGTTLRQVLGRRIVGSDGERLDARAIAALFVADRADHLASEIEPLLADGVHVICDRYVHSSLAYQGAECDPHWVAAINAPMRSPDVVLYVRVPVEVAAARRAARKGTPEIYEVDDFLRRVADGYDGAEALRPGERVVRIDGAADIEAVTAACQAAIRPLLIQSQVDEKPRTEHS